MLYFLLRKLQSAGNWVMYKCIAMCTVSHNNYCFPLKTWCSLLFVCSRFYFVFRRASFFFGNYRVIFMFVCIFVFATFRISFVFFFQNFLSYKLVQFWQHCDGRMCVLQVESMKTRLLRNSRICLRNTHALDPMSHGVKKKTCNGAGVGVRIIFWSSERQSSVQWLQSVSSVNKTYTTPNLHVIIYSILQ